MMVGGTDKDIPLWIADMDYAVDKQVVEAMKARCGHPVFGYSFQGKEYRQAIQRWYVRHHHLNVEEEAFLPCLNVLGAMQLILDMLTEPGDTVMMFTPIYPQFYRLLDTAGARLLEYPVYPEEAIDWEVVEKQVAASNVLLFCNPHNPLARVWTDAECRQVAELCVRHNVWLLSDEVHGDMAMFGSTYHCMAKYEMIQKRVVVFTSAAKTFNLAGLGGGCMIVPDQEIRDKVKKQLERYFQAEIGVLSAEGIRAAYEYGDAWLAETKEYLEGNVRMAQDFFAKHMPKLQCRNHQGTFLMWVDCRRLCGTETNIAERIKKDCHVLLDDGRRYGAAGAGFIRMNIACSRDLLKKALESLLPLYAALENSRKTKINEEGTVEL